MLLIRFINGYVLCGDKFEAGLSTTSKYHITNVDSLSSCIKSTQFIRLANCTEWYLVDKILSFRDITKDEWKQMQRDSKIESIT